MQNAEDMDKRQTSILKALDKIDINIMDANAVFNEINTTTTSTIYKLDSWSSNNTDLDEFDWSGIKFKPIDYKQASAFTFEQTTFGTSDFYKSVEAIISNGYLWEADQDDFCPSPELKISLGPFPTESREEKTDPYELLRLLDSLPSNGLDILSTDDAIFDTNRKDSGNIEFSVPIRICSEDDDWVIKADLPDIVFNYASADIFPEQLNFKSVLALLPERINTRQLRPSFVNGQFRLEIPKQDSLNSSKIK